MRKVPVKEPHVSILIPTRPIGDAHTPLAVAMEMEWIPFVASTSSAEKQPKKTTGSRSKQKSQHENGTDIKTFYEDLVGINNHIPSASHVNGDKSEKKLEKIDSAKIRHSESKHKTRKCRRKSISRNDLNGNKNIRVAKSDKSHDSEPTNTVNQFNMLLKASQNGDMKGLLEAVQNGADVNGQDQYGWSALMCASHAGFYDCVRALLDHGAIAMIQNKRGHTAWNIARIAKQNEVVHLLENYATICEAEEKSSDKVKMQTFFCDVCQSEVTALSEEKHICSLLHQFHLKNTSVDPGFVIPENNRGFQMMLKTGWDKEKGLGPEGTGKKYPVKTTLKRDRTGLGAKTEKTSSSKSKSKVTHFQANDINAVKYNRKMRDVTLSKRAASKKARKEKQMEHNFRLEFHEES